MVRSKDNLSDHNYRIVFEGLKHIQIKKTLIKINKKQAL